MLAIASLQPAWATNSNPGDPLFCNPDEGSTFLIVNGGSGVFTSNQDCYGNNLSHDTDTTIATSQGGTMTRVAGTGNYVYTPPTPDFTGLDTFPINVTTSINRSGGPGNFSGGAGTVVITLNVLPATSTMTAAAGVTVPIPVPAGSVTNCSAVGNSGNGPGPTDVYGCTTGVRAGSVHPAHGALRQVGNALNYTPTAGYYGTDTFTYQVLGVNDDGNTSLNSGDVTMHVAVPQVFMMGATPASLGMQLTQNQPQGPATSTISISATFQGNYQATSSASWLTLNPATGALPGEITASVDASSLAVGKYTANITITSGTQVTTVPVQVQILAALPLSASPSSLAIVAGQPIGPATGYDIQLGPAAASFTAQVSSWSAAWLSVNPASGVAPAVLHVVVDPTKAVFGGYQGSITVSSTGAPNSPLVIPVNLAVSGIDPTVPQENSATPGGAADTVAPNELVSLYLTDFSCPDSPQVSINGTSATLLGFVPGQLNYEVPQGATSGPLVVSCDGTTAWSYGFLNVAATIPGVFTAESSGAGQGSVLNADGSVNSPSNPAARGSAVSIYATGLGSYSPMSSDGLLHLAGNITAQIGGIPAAVLYAGEAPSQPKGLQQINVTVPAQSGTGAAVPMMLWVNGAAAQTGVTIAVQ